MGDMPLHVVLNRCAAVERAPGGQSGGNCTRPAAVWARWRFHDITKSLLLCDVHVAVLEGDERPHVSRLYDASVEDAPVA